MSLLSKFWWSSLGVVLSELRCLLKKTIAPAYQNITREKLENAHNVNRVDYILQFCSDKSVLHFGFTDFPYTEKKIQQSNLLHLQLKEVTRNLFGVDNDVPSVEEYFRLTGDSNFIIGDVMCLENLPKNIAFDIVLLGEILEHLKNPHQAIEVLYNLFPRNTFFLVTTPNYTSLQNFAAGLHKTEMIHPDHYWYFSPVTLIKLFSPERFELIDLNFGMHFQKGKRINPVLRKFPFLGECIIAVLKKI